MLTEPPEFLESALGLTIEERVDIEEAETAEGARPRLQDGSVSYLWLSNFISSFLTVTSFQGVLQSLDAWRSCMANELRFECRTLNYSRCQVDTIFQFSCSVYSKLVCVSNNVVVDRALSCVLVANANLVGVIYYFSLQFICCYLESCPVWVIPICRGAVGRVG